MSDDCLFYCLYPGHPGLVDVLVRDHVAPLVRQVTERERTRWFFLTYLDELGYHVRLRFLGDPDLLDHLYTELTPALRAGVSATAGREPELRRELIPLPGAAASVPVGDPLVVLRVYEREFDKYHGQEGMSRSEDLFERSSTLALRIRSLRLDPTALCVVATALMAATIGRVLPAARVDPFLSRYAWHWSGGATDGAAPIRAFAERQGTQLGARVSGRIEGTLTRSDLQGAVYAYAEDVAGTVHHIVDPADGPGVDDLLFHFLHLMNNRLGVPPLDEVGLAELTRSCPRSEAVGRSLSGVGA